MSEHHSKSVQPCLRDGYGTRAFWGFGRASHHNIAIYIYIHMEAIKFDDLFLVCRIIQFISTSQETSWNIMFGTYYRDWIPGFTWCLIRRLYGFHGCEARGAFLRNMCINQMSTSFKSSQALIGSVSLKYIFNGLF